MKVACVIPAGGVGLRMGSKTPKQLITLHGKSILSHTLINMQKIKRIDLIVVVTSEPLRDKVQKDVDLVLLETHCCPIDVVLRKGVDSRHSSIKTGVDYLKNLEFTLVIVHDAVRPMVPVELVEDLLQAAEEHGAAGPWVHLVSTVLKMDSNGLMQSTVPRYKDEDGSFFVASEMPQVFKFEILKTAYDLCDEHELLHGTECLELVRRYCGIQPKLIQGDQNVLWKVTQPRDLLLAKEALFNNR